MFFFREIIFRVRFYTKLKGCNTFPWAWTRPRWNGCDASSSVWHRQTLEYATDRTDPISRQLAPSTFLHSTPALNQPELLEVLVPKMHVPTTVQHLRQHLHKVSYLKRQLQHIPNRQFQQRVWSGHKLVSVAPHWADWRVALSQVVAQTQSVHHTCTARTFHATSNSLAELLQTNHS